jgi:hypothetical protein
MRPASAGTVILLTMAATAAMAEMPPAQHQKGRDPLAVAAEIDAEIDRKIAEAGVAASPQSTDSEFLRRATLDLIGRVPTVDRAAAFLADARPDKRQRLIDELLDSPEYGRHFGQVWHNRINPLDAENRRRFDEPLYLWLAAQFNANRPWGGIVSDLLLAEGEVAERPTKEPVPAPTVGFYLANADEGYVQPERVTASAASLFLGVQLQCAQCHNHPFAKWKQTDFWGLAVFFARTGYEADVGQTRNKKQPVILREAPVVVMKGGKRSPFVRDDASVEIP